MPQIVARFQPIALIPLQYPELAKTIAFDPAPNLTVARGTLLGQVNAGSATNDVDTITLTNATGGTFTVTVANNGGTQTTAPLAYNASPATVQAAIQGLTNIGTNNATVTGTAGSSYVITGAGAFANLPLGTVTVSGTALTGTSPTAAVVHTTSPLYPGSVKPYAAGNTDGSQVPVCISLYDFSTDANGNVTLGVNVPFGLAQGHDENIPGYISGWFRKDDIPNLDNNAIALLFARSFQTPDGVGSIRIP